MLRPFGPHFLDTGVPGIIQQPLKVLEERVLVLIEEAQDAVSHVAGVVRNSELDLVFQGLLRGFHLPGHVVLVSLQFPIHRFQQHFIRYLLRRHLTGVV